MQTFPFTEIFHNLLMTKGKIKFKIISAGKEASFSILSFYCVIVEKANSLGNETFSQSYELNSEI